MVRSGQRLAESHSQITQIASGFEQKVTNLRNLWMALLA